MPMTKGETLAAQRQAFVQRWGPSDDEYGYFEIDLDRLIYAAFAVAQEPYVRQHELFRETVLDKLATTPIPPRGPPE